MWRWLARGTSFVICERSASPSARSWRTTSHINAFAGFLQRHRYAHQTAMMYFASVRHIGAWMAARHLAVEDLDEAAIETFDRHLPRCRCQCGRLRGAATGVKHFLRYLREHGIARPRQAPAPPPAIITEYREWMKAHRGVGENTLNNYARYLIRFLRVAGCDPSKYEPRTLRKFVVAQQSAKKTMISAVRTFIRFLIATKRCSTGLDHVVPSIAQWRLSSLPRYLPSADVERVIATAPIGSRDRAVLLLLARLGLRRGDIVALALADIDWSKGFIRVAGKSRRLAYLPLPSDVGNAILAYLRGQRLQADTDKVFVTAQAPIVAITPDTVSGIVYWAIRRAGIRAPSRGCQLLRHSAATRWLREGLSMADIGVLLRH